MRRTALRRSAIRLGGIVLVAGVLHVALGAYACGDPVGGAKGEGEPCTRTSECQLDLTCTGGVCRRAGDGGGPRDAGDRFDATIRDGAALDGDAAPPGDAAPHDAAAIDAATIDDASSSDEDAAPEDADASADAA